MSIKSYIDSLWDRRSDINLCAEAHRFQHLRNVLRQTSSNPLTLQILLPHVEVLLGSIQLGLCSLSLPSSLVNLVCYVDINLRRALAKVSLGITLLVKVFFVIVFIRNEIVLEIISTLIIFLGIFIGAEIVLLSPVNFK